MQKEAKSIIRIAIIGFVVVNIVIGIITSLAEGNEGSIEDFLDSIMPEDFNFSFGEIRSTIMLFLVIGFLAFLVFMIVRGQRKHQRLKVFGIKQLCPVKGVNDIKDDKGNVTGKKVTVETPLGRKGSYKLPKNTDIRQNDLLLITYDPENADLFNIHYEGGKPVIQTRRTEY